MLILEHQAQYFLSEGAVKGILGLGAGLGLAGAIGAGYLGHSIDSMQGLDANNINDLIANHSNTEAAKAFKANLNQIDNLKVMDNNGNFDKPSTNALKQGFKYNLDNQYDQLHNHNMWTYAKAGGMAGGTIAAGLGGGYLLARRR